MSALIVPPSAPVVLLATVMGLSWWQEHVLPSAEAAVAPSIETPITPAARPRSLNPPS